MLMPCARCGRHVSLRDEQCPFCRAPNALVRFGGAALAAGLVLASCDAGEKPGKRDPQNATSPAMPHATGISGVVTDRKNQPLVGARVLLRDATNNVLRDVKTDGAGRYTLDPLPPGAYVMVIEYAGVEGGMQRNGGHERNVSVAHGEPAKVLDVAVDVHEHSVAPPYGAPPARRRAV